MPFLRVIQHGSSQNKTSGWSALLTISALLHFNSFMLLADNKKVIQPINTYDTYTARSLGERKLVWNRLTKVHMKMAKKCKRKEKREGNETLRPESFTRWKAKRIIAAMNWVTNRTQRHLNWWRNSLKNSFKMPLTDHSNWRLVVRVTNNTGHNLLHCSVLGFDQHSTEVSTTAMPGNTKLYHCMKNRRPRTISHNWVQTVTAKYWLCFRIHETLDEYLWSFVNFSK